MKKFLKFMFVALPLSVATLFYSCTEDDLNIILSAALETILGDKPVTSLFGWNQPQEKLNTINYAV